ncbi:hypothetical protein R5R35_008069 [Gryllus longicercus]|uniref:Uncharacterized protein n=1 Tax=Gryllus longicercus TaxID=2509291 RepID=A0AAN9VM55_9ORTH
MLKRVLSNEDYTDRDMWRLGCERLLLAILLPHVSGDQSGENSLYPDGGKYLLRDPPTHTHTTDRSASDLVTQQGEIAATSRDKTCTTLTGVMTSAVDLRNHESIIQSIKNRKRKGIACH